MLAARDKGLLNQVAKSFAALVALGLMSSDFTFAAAPGVGERLPSALGRLPSGEKITLEQVLEAGDTPMVITFWASWCAPCMKELPVLESIADIAGNRLRVFAINWKEDRRMLKKFVRQNPDLKIRILHDRTGRAARQYDLKGIPFLLLVKPDGTLFKSYRGYNEDSLPKIVDAKNDMLEN